MADKQLTKGDALYLKGSEEFEKTLMQSMQVMLTRKLTAQLLLFNSVLSCF